MIDTTIDILRAGLPKTPRMPALFVGHGSPMHGVIDSVYAQAWKELGRTLPRPSLVLSISAHWLAEGTHLTSTTDPRTIHDFFGFPDELYAVNYPAPGSPTAVHEILELLRNVDALPNDSWGIDHGTWTVLRRMYPDAQIPVIQLSIDFTKAPQFHYELGALLAPLRERGVLIFGSGNIVHNLRDIDGRANAPVMDWADHADRLITARISDFDHASLCAYHQLGAEVRHAIPTPDHFLPLLSLLGTITKEDEITFPVTGIDLGSISMRAVLATPRT